METDTLSFCLELSTSSIIPLKEANGPSDTLICSPTSYSNFGFGLSAPSVISCSNLDTSFSEIANGLFLTPKKLLTLGISLTKCQVSSFICILTRT